MSENNSKKISIEQNIIHAMEISRYTKIPVLFMSNPGLGKTTILKRYAKKYNYHLEILIGSRFTPEEISGYQVNNGGNHLTHMNPEWFNRIQEKSQQGQSTLLFIDELSTCSEFVQGALLSLIFDRTIGNEKFLPENCFIAAAANYSGNLPDSMTMMAPTLNRFMIINLNDNYNALNLLEEFLNPPESPEYPSKPSNQDKQGYTSFIKKYQEIWRDIFFKYSNPKSSLGYLDISNRNLSDLYSGSQGSVYNFISGRTISYLAKALYAYKLLKIQNQDIFNKVVDGLVGAGSCLFISENQGIVFRKMLHDKFYECVSAIDSVNKDRSEYGLPMVNDISKDIASYIVNKDNPSISRAQDYGCLKKIACLVLEKYASHKLFECISNQLGQAKFITDYNSIITLIKQLYVCGSVNEDYWKLYHFVTTWYGYYCNITGQTMNYHEFFGTFNKHISCIVLVKTLGVGKIENYFPAAIGSQDGLLYAMEDNDLYSTFVPSQNKLLTKTDNLQILSIEKTEASFKPAMNCIRAYAGR